MPNKEKSSEIIESGDIFFFYRPKVDSEKVDDLYDVQRFYMVLAPESSRNKNKNKENDKELYRLFLLGRKKLPDVIEGKSSPTERNWALNTLTTTYPNDLEEELLTAAVYPTETKGRRKLPSAIPTGEGKYSLVQHDNHTELAYVLELPESPGPSQKEFEIKKEASYIASVKNPDINIKGFGSFSEKKPEYPTKIKELFGDRRWINIEDKDILNFENTQLLLIGARKKDVEEELEIEIDEEKESENTADLFKRLKIDKEKIPTRPLFNGKFPTSEEINQATKDIKHIPKEEAPGGKGSKKGGKVAASSATSAAAIAKILGGIELPKKKEELIKYAENNKSKVKNAEEIIQVIKELPENKSFKTMADIEKALSEIR